MSDGKVRRNTKHFWIEVMPPRGANGAIVHGTVICEDSQTQIFDEAIDFISANSKNFGMNWLIDLVFGLFASPVLYNFHSQGAARNTGGPTGSCPSWGVVAQSSQGAPIRSSGRSGAGCRDCRLVAHAGAAAPPDCFASFARPMRIAASRVRYFALSMREMEASVSNREWRPRTSRRRSPSLERRFSLSSKSHPEQMRPPRRISSWRDMKNEE